MPSTSPPIRHGRLRPWSIAVAVAVLTVGSVGTLVLGSPATEADETPEPTLVVGEPMGEVIPQATPAPTTAAAPAVTEAPTAQPSPAPSPTPAPVAASNPTPQPPPAATPPPTQAPPPPPTAAVAVTSPPQDTVAAFYGHVANGNFDAAYALWSDRMKATYPRAENLDGRFANTASIVFSELYVASQSATAATVQANFTETYDSGSSRHFIGYWELIVVNGQWILDAPHY